MYNIIYHHNLRLGEGLSEKDIDKIKKDLSENPIEANLFLITISANSDEQLDIYDAKFLVQKYFQKWEWRIIWKFFLLQKLQKYQD